MPFAEVPAAAVITGMVPRSCLCWCLLALLPITCSAQTLRQEADRTGVLLGAAVNAAYLSEPAYTSILAREFNMVEPEDATQWSTVHAAEEVFDFTQADRIVLFARTHGMKVRADTLLWGRHNPAWLTDTHYTPNELSNLLHDHIRRVMSHYRGQVFAWDVVNEAFDENGHLRHSIWYNQPGIGMAEKGTAFIEQAFRWAHAEDPQALLFYNDAEDEAANPKSDAIYAMVKDFRKRGVPIDGVGLQMHILDLNPDLNSIAANIERFTKLGVQIHITEMDVALPINTKGAVTDPSDLSRQAKIYGEIASICFRYRGCTALQMWGFTDKYSWIGWFTNKTKGAALPFDKNYRAKPAYDALRQAFVAAPNR